MYVVVAYDVNVQTKEGRKRLREVAKICLNYGQRVQFSVFECLVTPDLWNKVKAALEKTINPATDSLRYYYLGKNWQNRVDSFGTAQTYDPDEFLLI